MPPFKKNPYITDAVNCVMHLLEINGSVVPGTRVIQLIKSGCDPDIEYNKLKNIPFDGKDIALFEKHVRYIIISLRKTPGYEGANGVCAYWHERPPYDNKVPFEEIEPPGSLKEAKKCISRGGKKPVHIYIPKLNQDPRFKIMQKAFDELAYNTNRNPTIERSIMLHVAGHITDEELIENLNYYLKCANVTQYIENRLYIFNMLHKNGLNIDPARIY